MRVLVDINSILDVLAYRQTFYEDSARVWSAVENRQVEGFIAAHTVTTIYYLTRKHRSRQAASSAIADLLRIFSVAVLDGELLLQALSLGWDDFEDAVQAVSAAKCRCHYIITRDINSRNSPVQFIAPADFNRLLATGL